MKFLTNLDLSQNEIQNAIIQPLVTAPANPKLGQIYYNSSDSLLYQYDGAQWKPVGKGYELPAATKIALGETENTASVSYTHLTLPTT